MPMGILPPGMEASPPSREESVGMANSEQALVAGGGAGVPPSWSGGVGMTSSCGGHKRETWGGRQRRPLEA